MNELLKPMIVAGTFLTLGLGMMFYAEVIKENDNAKKNIKPSLTIKEKSPDALVINTNVYRQPFSYIINERDGRTKLLSFDMDMNAGTVTNVFVHSAYTGSVTFEDDNKETALRQLEILGIVEKFITLVYDKACQDPLWKTNQALATYNALSVEVQNCALRALNAQKELLRKAE